MRASIEAISGFCVIAACIAARSREAGASWAADREVRTTVTAVVRAAARMLQRDDMKSLLDRGRTLRPGHVNGSSRLFRVLGARASRKEREAADRSLPTRSHRLADHWRETAGRRSSRRDRSNGARCSSPRGRNPGARTRRRTGCRSSPTIPSLDLVQREMGSKTSTPPGSVLTATRGREPRVPTREASASALTTWCPHNAFLAAQREAYAYRRIRA